MYEAPSQRRRLSFGALWRGPPPFKWTALCSELRMPAELITPLPAFSHGPITWYVYGSTAFVTRDLDHPVSSYTAGLNGYLSVSTRISASNGRNDTPRTEL